MSDSAERAPLFEIFSSIQGEATHVGERHLFVRLAGCDLDCVFCDTPASRRIPEQARLFLPSGVRELPNPLSADDLVAAVAALDEESGPHHMISITGGEPLLFVPFLQAVLPRWRTRGGRILLETGGHRPDELAAVLGHIDVVMVDVKIASSAGIETSATVQRRFLGLASRVECTVKVVVSEATTTAEIESVASMVSEVAPQAPLILQPVSGAKFGPPTGAHALLLQRAAMRQHHDTRVIVQTHRILHLR